MIAGRVCLLFAGFAMSCGAFAQQAGVLELMGKDATDGDFTAAINQGLSQGKIVRLSQGQDCYKISKTLVFTAGSGLEGVPEAAICVVGTELAFSVDNSATGVSIRNVVFRGAPGGKVLGVIKSAGFAFHSGGASQAGAIVFSGATKCVVDGKSQFLDGLATALVLTKGTSGCEVNGAEFERNVGFGILLNEGANDNSILHNRTTRNGIELVGIQDGAYNNVVSYNHAEGSGDNGISVTGDNNRITGNEAVRNKLTGIFVYGGNNMVASNVAIANGQAHNPASFNYSANDKSKYAGVEVSGAFGGSGYGNTIRDNRTDDDQTPPTQAYGTWIGPGYGVWHADTAYTSGRYIYSEGNLYRLDNAGLSGKKAPDCVSSACSDGQLNWVYVKRLPGNSPEPRANKLSGNVAARSGLAAFFDSTRAHDNDVTVK